VFIDSTFIKQKYIFHAEKKLPQIQQKYFNRNFSLTKSFSLQNKNKKYLNIAFLFDFPKHQKVSKGFRKILLYSSVQLHKFWLSILDLIFNFPS
jgi:hypothetical protein